MKSEMKKSKYRQILLGMNLKQTLITIPKLAAINAVLVLLLGILTFLGIKVSKSEASVEPVRVALVSEDDSWWIKTLESYLEKNINCKFIQMTEQEAMEAIEKREVTSILKLPKDVVSAIMNSQEGAATLIFHSPGQITATKTFQNLAKTGMADIAAMDASEKLIATIQKREKGRINYKEVYIIEDNLIKEILVRGRIYDKQIFSDSGTLGLVDFYVGNCLLALVLLTGMFLQELLTRKGEAYLVSLDCIGISNFEVSIYQYLSVTIVYTAFFYILYLVLVAIKLLTFSPLALISIPVFVMSTTAFLFLIYQICDNKMVASMIVFLGSLVMMFFSGNILPLSFLPKAARYLSYVLPTKYLSQIAGEIVGDCISIKTIFVGLGWFAGFILVDFIFCIIRKNSQK